MDRKGVRVCPACEEGNNGGYYHYTGKLEMYMRLFCTLCDGVHTQKPESDSK